MNEYMQTQGELLKKEIEEQLVMAVDFLVNGTDAFCDIFESIISDVFGEEVDFRFLRVLRIFRNPQHMDQMQHLLQEISANIRESMPNITRADISRVGNDIKENLRQEFADVLQDENFQRLLTVVLDMYNQVSN